METEHYIFCGGIPPKNTGTDTTNLALNLWNPPPDCNVRLNIEHLHEKLFKNIPAQFLDLLEIAAYVNCGDQAYKRGALDVQTLGARWRRKFRFHIPVRQLSLWNDSNVKSILQETLGFLSDDQYDFTFYPATNEPVLQRYFTDFDTGPMPRQMPEQVMMFSGGLDSLAGAIENIVVEKRKIVLVNHQSTPKFNRLYDDLSQKLLKKSGDIPPINLRVEINKAKALNKEYTQRSRSFLYASLGAAVAKMFGLHKFCFYENGVVGLNLPVCAQVIGGRATRTTHPRVLAGMAQLLSLLADEPFGVENPFQWFTKGEVVKKIVAANCGELIASSRSCAHTWETTNEHTHCGTCSQCIDRRFGIIAGNAEAFDPLSRYKLDIVTQSPPDDTDKIMVASYLNAAIRCGGLKDVPQFIKETPEVMRVLRYVQATPTGAAQRILDLHKRHANEVTEALKKMLGQNLDGVIKATLPPDCLLRISYETGSSVSLPAVEQEIIITPEPVPAKVVPTPAAENVIRTIGRFRYLDDLNDIWLGDDHYDLRERTKARLCIKYLVENQAFDAVTARHFLNQIDRYVREEGNYPPSADIKIDHYFNDQIGLLPKLRKDLIRAAGRNGKFYLNTN